MWEYEDYYDEPNEFEQQIQEFKDSLIQVVKREHQEEISRLREENNRLSAIETTMQEKTRELDKELKDIQYRKENLKREVKDEFYKSSLDDILQDYIENDILWFADKMGHEQDKCEYCNEKRVLTHTYPDGQTIEKKCKCADLVYWYEPRITENTFIKIRKRDSRYNSERSFYLSRSYTPNSETKRRSTYDEYEDREFHVEHIIEEFTDETMKLHDDLGYCKYIVFKTEKECQKYCDWLNSKNTTN